MRISKVATSADSVVSSQQFAGAACAGWSSSVLVPTLLPVPLLPTCPCCCPIAAAAASRALSCCCPVPQEPEAATEGLGGTYFFANEAGQKIAIMKPCDEEPLAPNNPKGFVGRQLGEPGLKPTVRVGEAASREVRAREGHRGTGWRVVAAVCGSHACILW